MKDRITMGLDAGSTTSKCVILKNGETVLGSAVIGAGTGTSGPGRAVSQALSAAGIKEEQIGLRAATGYGRNRYAEEGPVLSELSAHAIAAAALFPGVRTLIDIGGQDAKVISLNERGQLVNFLMNDKCAAGTGRFLEVMARVLELSVEELAQRDAASLSPVSISSTCTVFAESEVISKLSENVQINDLVAGIHGSVASKTAGLVRRLGLKEPVGMSGGVAQNEGVVRALSRELGTEITVIPEPQLSGAYGAALYAYRKLIQNEKP